jgi:hypothetical protein
MKFFLIAAIIISISLSGCKKNQTISNIPNADTTSGSFSAIIDGKQWVSSDSTKSASLLNGILNVSGASDDGQTITISLTDTIPGTYILNQNSSNIATYTDIVDNSSFQNRYLSTNQNSDNSLSGGEVVVKEIDKTNKTISGTFILNEYTDSAGYKKNITHGIFNQLHYISSLQPMNATDTFSVQINGSLWNAQSVSVSNVNGFLLVNGSALDDSKSVGIYITYFSGLDYSDSVFYLSNFLGQYNNDHTSSFNSYDSACSGNSCYISSNGSLTIIEYNPLTRRLRGQFYFNGYAAGSKFYPPSSQGNFIFLPPAQPVQVSEGYFSMKF